MVLYIKHCFIYKCQVLIPADYHLVLEEILEVPSKSINIDAFIGNKSVIEFMHSSKLIEVRRLRIDNAALTEAVTQRDVRKMQWCSGQEQLANCQTKAKANDVGVLEILQTGRMCFSNGQHHCYSTRHI